MGWCDIKGVWATIGGGRNAYRMYQYSIIQFSLSLMNPSKTVIYKQIFLVAWSKIGTSTMALISQSTNQVSENLMFVWTIPIID